MLLHLQVCPKSGFKVSFETIKQSEMQRNLEEGFKTHSPSRGDVVVSVGGEGGAAVIAFAVVLFVVIGGTVAGPGAFVVVEVEVGFGSFSVWYEEIMKEVKKNDLIRST